MKQKGFRYIQKEVAEIIRSWGIEPRFETGLFNNTTSAIEALKTSGLLHLSGKFFHILNLQEIKIEYSINTENYLPLSDNHTLEDFLSFIDDGTEDRRSLQSYALWARASYLLSKEILHLIDPSRLAYKIEFPLKLKDGNIYWVQQDSRPLEVDSAGKLISHINSYTVMSRFNANQDRSVVAEYFYDEVINNQMTKALYDIRFSTKLFIPKPIQNEILHFFKDNKEASIKQCAINLNYPYNTIKKYISDSQHKKGILNLVREAYPYLQFHSMKEVVSFFELSGWFEINDQ